METTCQASYPLNSENASPPGTFKVYLSWAAWADRALPPKALTSAVTVAIVRMRLLFITNSSFVKLGGLDFFPDRAWYNRHTAALCQRCRRLRPQRHSVGALARRARVPRGDQSDGPPAGAGVDRPPSPRPRRCHQRHDRASPGNRKAAARARAWRSINSSAS